MHTGINHMVKGYLLVFNFSIHFQSSQFHHVNERTKIFQRNKIENGEREIASEELKMMRHPSDPYCSYKRKERKMPYASPSTSL